MNETLRMVNLAELFAKSDEESRIQAIHCEQLKADMVIRLNKLQSDIPELSYFGINAGGERHEFIIEEVWNAKIWLSGFSELDSTPRTYSYYLKHVAEKAIGSYISDGSLIAAALLSGIPVSFCEKSPNASIAIPPRAAKAAAEIANKNATFRDIVIIEPRLKQLADDAKAYKRESKNKNYVCANDRWYGYREWKGNGLKNRLCRLVGWLSSNYLLENTHSYDVAYRAIYAMLPNCKHCKDY